MLKTRYEVTIELNEKKFVIVVSQLSAAQSELLKKESKKDEDVQKKYNSIHAQYQNILSISTLNVEMLKELKDGDKEKLKILAEQKSLFVKSAALLKELHTLEGKLPDQEVKNENIARQKFNYVVSGENKEALEQAILDSGLTFVKFNGYLNQLIKEAHEKK